MFSIDSRPACGSTESPPSLREHVKLTLGVESSSEVLHYAFTRATFDEQTNTIYGRSETMNHISAEANVIEAEVNELQALAAAHTDEAITELSSAQLLMVGGGSGIAILT
jgi:hypothetical protein